LTKQAEGEQSPLISGDSLQAIIFDMDGTLVSSRPLLHHCISEICEKYTGKALTLEEVVAKFGPPIGTIIRSITARLSEEEQERAVRDYYDCHRNNVSSKVVVFPGISRLLERIRSSGRRLALMTGVERAIMEPTLNAFGLQAYFDERITVDDVRNTKPDPEGILLALARIRADLKRSIYIGDAPADIVAGRRAGVFTGAALWSPQTGGDPSREKPDFQFRSVQQLSDFLFPKR
jgi:HAD superfamily hydrolase (TIGR01509 family)